MRFFKSHSQKGAASMLAGIRTWLLKVLAVEVPSEKKRFGLAEATAAVGFVSEPSQVRAIMAVVLGVLGYENVVQKEVAEQADKLQADLNWIGGRITTNELEIIDLKALIAQLNETALLVKNDRENVIKIGELFKV